MNPSASDAKANDSPPTRSAGMATTMPSSTAKAMPHGSATSHGRSARVISTPVSKPAPVT